MILLLFQFLKINNQFDFGLYRQSTNKKLLRDKRIALLANMALLWPLKYY